MNPKRLTWLLFLLNCVYMQCSVAQDAAALHNLQCLPSTSGPAGLAPAYTDTVLTNRCGSSFLGLAAAGTAVAASNTITRNDSEVNSFTTSGTSSAALTGAASDLPNAWAVMLSVIGLVAWQLRRTHKSLQSDRLYSPAEIVNLTRHPTRPRDATPLHPHSISLNDALVSTEVERPFSNQRTERVA